MLWKNVSIESIAHKLAPIVLTSDAIEERLSATMKRFQIPKGRLEALTGIKERRLYPEGTLPSLEATDAAKLALEKAEIAPEDLDLLINAAIVRELDEPSTATLVGGHLKVGHHCTMFDLSNACLGFVSSIVQAANAIELGQARYALVVSCEDFTVGIQKTIDLLTDKDVLPQTFRDHFANLTLGCGAVAMVLSHKDVAKGHHRLTSGATRTAAEHNGLCTGVNDQMYSDPQALKIHGTNLVAENWPFFMEASGWDHSSIDRWICHQVGTKHIQGILERLNQPVENAPITADYLGNCGSVALPITLSVAVERGEVRDGQRLAFYAVGSGLGSIMLGVDW